MKPKRIQLSRRKGFRLQKHSMALNGLPAVNVARPSKWGNPFAGEGSVKNFRLCVLAPTTLVLNPAFNDKTVQGRMRKLQEGMNRLAYIPPTTEEIQRELCGKNLACWCPPNADCHADVLLEIANKETQ